MKKLIIFLIVFSMAGSAFAIGQLESQYKRKFLGINPRVNPRLLSDDEATDASNITLDETGAFSDRDIFSQYNSVSGVLGNNFITGLFKYYTSSSKYFIACAGSKVALGSAGAFSTDISPTTNTVIIGTYWSASTFNNYEYMFNPSIPMMKYDTIRTNLYPPVSQPATNCAYSAVHKARLWAARADTTPYRLYFSSLNDGDDWGTTGGYINLPDISQTITGLISWGGYLYVFTETNIYIIQGSTPNDFSMRKTNSMVGAIAPRSIKISDIGIIFLSRTGLFAFDGNSSHKLSDKIEPIINSISKTQIQNACGIYDGQSKYWLSYTDKTSSYNNKILIYDTILKEWYPFNNLNISYFERAYSGTDKGELYGGSSTKNGIVYSLQAAGGTESIVHNTKSDFDNQITDNTIVYSTPSVVLETHPDDYDRLLVHFNGANNDVAYQAETKQTLTFNDNAHLNTSIVKYGTASLILDGADDRITVPSSTTWDFNGDFTIETWIYTPLLNTTTAFLATTNKTATLAGWLWSYNKTTKLFSFAASSGGGAFDVVSVGSTTTWEPTANTWYHLAVVRNAGTITFYADGVSLGSAVDASAITSTGNPLYIGDEASVTTYHMAGNMDDVRISAIARYYANFTPPGEFIGNSNGKLYSQNVQINAAGTSALGVMSWLETLPVSTNKITFQTRTGATNDTVYYNGWQYWSSANSVTLSTVTDATTMFKPAGRISVQAPIEQRRWDTKYYEDENTNSVNCVQFQVHGAPSINAYADGFISYTDLTNYDWVTIWYRAPSTATGNSIVFYMSKDANTLSNHSVTFNTVSNSTINGWYKGYWYIGDWSASDKNGIRYIRVKNLSDQAGYLYVGEIEAHNYYTVGDTISSSPNDWIQYRAILANDGYFYTPELDSVTLTYTPVSGTAESSLSTYYQTKFMDFQTPQIDKAYIDFFAEVYNDDNSSTCNTVVYVDYSVDDGIKTGTISLSITTTGNTVRIKKHFPSNVFGKTLRLKFYHNDKNAKVTVRAVEVRYRKEGFN